MILAWVENAANAAHLSILGGFHPDASEGLGKTLLLLGPGAGFWDHVSRSPEMQDGEDNPMDRWSNRVIDDIADTCGARALFPFGGPPHHPFITWATRSGRCWASPVNLLIHADQGMWVSFRGALVFDDLLDVPAPATRPCDSCEDKPCLAACPVGALTPEGYDVPGCKSYLADDPPCMTHGCAVRRACPVSQGHDRDPAQSAFHMEAFR